FKNLKGSGPTATGPTRATVPAVYNTKQGTPFSETQVRQLAASYNTIFSPRVLHEVRVGYANTVETGGYPLATQGGDLIKQYGFTGLPPTPVSGGIPDIEFGDGSFIATGGEKPRNILSRTIQFNDNLTWLRGSHSFKAGADIQYVDYKDQVTFFQGEDY